METTSYDKLIRLLMQTQIKNWDCGCCNNCVALRVAEDMNIKNAFRNQRSVFEFIGGGYIGLEIAASLVKLDAYLLY